MWVDDDGVLHTVSLPDPTELMTEEFRTGLDAIRDAEGVTLRAILEKAEGMLFEMNWSDLSKSERHVAAPPPMDILQGHVATPEDVSSAIQGVDLRWRLDAITALDEYID